MVRIQNLIILQLVAVTIAQLDDDFYCRAKEDKWAICRRCLETDKKCFQDPDGCHCENVQVADPKQNDKLIGGSDCKDGFCYISVESSNCSDKWDGYDPFAYTLEDYWHQGSTTDDKLFKSKVACEKKEIFDTGNKEVMNGVQILEDYLYGVTEITEGGNLIVDSTPKEPLTVFADDYTECMEECKDRCGICGGWSFDETEGICYLHTADACCGQKAKQVATNSNFVSGYFCIHCWSTKNQCPCSLKKRLSGQLGCSIAQNSGGETPHYNNPTGKLQVHSTPINEDKCKCEGKLFGKGRRKRCRCIKPQCSSDFDDGKCNSGCCDKRRCRERASKRQRQSCELK